MRIWIRNKVENYDENYNVNYNDSCEDTCDEIISAIYDVRLVENVYDSYNKKYAEKIMKENVLIIMMTIVKQNML